MVTDGPPNADGGSSNGRTADSDSASGGSNPSPPAKFGLIPNFTGIQRPVVSGATAQHHS